MMISIQKLAQIRDVMDTEPAEGRVRRGKDDVIDDGIRDDDLDDNVIDDGLDGEGELKYEMLWAQNRRKVEYARAKMMYQ
jgi:hypothetical protein